MKISQILDKIDENQLFVPAFQREYVWRREDAKNLIVSLFKEYPTGTLLTWETQKPPELKGKWQYNEKQGAVKLILDGQQRITTLYMLIRGEIPPYYVQADITNDTRNLYINLETSEFQYYKKTQMENNPVWINITDVFQKKVKLYDLYKEKDRSEHPGLKNNFDVIAENFSKLDKIPDLDFIEQQIPVKASLKEAIDIFYIVNASGVNLTEAELALAQISGYWPQARERFKLKLEELKKGGFVFSLDFVVYILLGVLYNQGADMRKLHSSDNLERLKSAWDLLESKVIDHVINLIRTHAFIDHSREINSVYALVPIIVFTFKKHVNKETLSEVEIKKIIKWFFYSQIRQRYISQLPQKLDKDNNISATSEQPFDELLNIIKAERPLEITSEEFIGVDIRNALYSLMTCYFKSRNAVCFTTGVGIRKNMGIKYSLEWDHIFPYSVLKNNGYNINNRIKYSLAQEITNRAVLTQLGNRGKSDQPALDYLTTVKAKYPKALELQLIPMEEKLWKLENYESFLQKRREMLADHLNNFLNSLVVTEENIGKITLDELIREGESQDLEMKTSFHWNYDENKIDANYHYAILRTIAAFANSKGGTLILGVNDEGKVLGLAMDYSSIGGDKEEFEIYFIKQLTDEFSNSFVEKNIKIDFFKIENEDVCRIEIKGNNKPVFIHKPFDKIHDSFFVRAGTFSKEIKSVEMENYIKDNFKMSS